MSEKEDKEAPPQHNNSSKGRGAPNVTKLAMSI